MNGKKVSVVIPVYNNEKTIGKIIDSFLENEYENLEILIGNDASTDNTEKELDNYILNKKVIIYHFKINKGPGAVRNFLIKKCTGDYILIHDADDFIDREKVKIQVCFLENNPHVDVLGTGALLVNGSGKCWRIISPKSEPGKFEWLVQRSVIHATIMLRSSSIGKAKYCEKIRLGEDYYFLTCLYLNGANVRNLTNPLYVYNIDENELATRSLRHFKKLVQAKIEISKLFKFHERFIFILINLLLLSLGWLRGYLLGSRK